MDSESTDLRILWASPLPPTRSGIADYAAELLPELAGLARVRVLTPPEWTAPEDWPGSLEMVAGKTPAESGEITLVHLGNNPHHLWLLERLAGDRVVVVLHDVVLHHLLVEATVAAGKPEAYRDRLGAAHGAAGVAVAAARAVGVSGHLDPFLFSARRTFLDGAAGAVVHSAWAEATLRREAPHLRVGRVGLAVADPGLGHRQTARARLGLAPDEVVLMHLGFLTPAKGLHEVLTGFAAAVRTGIPARLVVVGEGDSMRCLTDAAAAVGVADRVGATGYVAAAEFPSIPAAADLGVVLRTPSAGETSAAAVRFFACGVPVAVGGHRQFLEWPEEAAPRLTPGPPAAAELARLLTKVETPQWRGRGRTARHVYESSHRPQDAARALVSFLGSLESG